MRLPDAIAASVGDRHLERDRDGQSGAAVFRARGLDADCFLKVGQGSAAALVADEAARLHWLAGRVPTPRVIATAQEHGSAWLLTEALPGLCAGAFIKADRRRASAVARTVASFLRRLHALPTGDCPFDSSVTSWLPVVRGLVADGLVDADDFDDEHAGWSPERVLAKVEEMAPHEQGRVVVHGDFSLGNLIIGEDGEVAGCIDVGRLGVGDPYRAIFIGWRDLGGFGPDAQQAFLEALGIETLEEPRRELHRALDELL